MGKLTLNDIEAQLKGARWSGDQLRGKCPNPSCGNSSAFAATEKDGKLLMSCHACNAKFKDLLVFFGAAPDSSQTIARPQSKPKPNHTEVATEARKIWEEALPADASHHYLTKKGIGAHGLKQDSSGKLLIPAKNIYGEITTIQKISANGEKRFLKGGQKKGSFSTLNEQPIYQTGEVYICEGLATAYSIQEATSKTTICAFDADNLLPVAKALRQRYPALNLILCGDDDRFKDTNKGREAAIAAALAVNGKVVFPSFISNEDKPTDFNDLHSREGLDAVKTQVEAAVTPDEPTDRRFKFQSLQEVMNNFTLPEWVVKGIFETDCLCGIYGPPESYKSFVEIDLGLFVAAGISWHGHAIKKQGPVLYICGEGERGVKRRIKAWMIEHEVTTLPPFFISSCAASLLDSKNLKEVDSAIDQIIESNGPPAMIIIDTLNRNMGPGDENSTQDMTAYIKAVDHLRARTHAAIHTVHHTGLSDANRARGSSVLKAALDFEYSTKRKDQDLVELSFTKLKDHEKPKSLVFETNVIPLGEYDDELTEACSIILRLTDKPTGVDKPKLPKAARIALEGLTWLESENKGAVHVDAWRAEAYKRGIAEKPEARTRAFSRARDRLLDEQLVSCDGDMYQLFKEDEFDLEDSRTPDIAGHCRTLSASVPVNSRTDTDTPPKGCPVSGTGRPAKGDFDGKENNSFLNEKLPLLNEIDMPPGSDSEAQQSLIQAGWVEP